MSIELSRSEICANLIYGLLAILPTILPFKRKEFCDVRSRGRSSVPAVVSSVLHL